MKIRFRLIDFLRELYLGARLIEKFMSRSARELFIGNLFPPRFMDFNFKSFISKRLSCKLLHKK